MISICLMEPNCIKSRSREANFHPLPLAGHSMHTKKIVTRSRMRIRCAYLGDFLLPMTGVVLKGAERGFLPRAYTTMGFIKRGQ